MKYAVIYQSESGNTRQVAEAVFEAIETEDKILFDIDTENGMPEADIYFVGFGVHNGNCSMDIVECLEKIEDARFALFMTCGFTPSEKYKEKILSNLDVWFPETSELLGTFLCQGSVRELQKCTMINKMPEMRDKIEYMLKQGESHPDGHDLQAVSDFALEIQRKVRDRGRFFWEKKKRNRV